MPIHVFQNVVGILWVSMSTDEDHVGAVIGDGQRLESYRQLSGVVGARLCKEGRIEGKTNKVDRFGIRGTGSQIRAWRKIVDGAILGFTKAFTKIPTWKELIDADKVAYRTRNLYTVMKWNIQEEAAEKVEEKEKDFLKKAGTIAWANKESVGEFQIISMEAAVKEISEMKINLESLLKEKTDGKGGGTKVSEGKS